ncbi:PLP-dependent aminotransferase family protein [Lentzea sp. JNUCC 0626]|uniref:MocR-like pyridoxine biosynthesis transcription factor PdxR n=1 Tax=Lentzea sp. JNUCC 0626 TaxID=3367513 RepID=UPI00374802FD
MNGVDLHLEVRGPRVLAGLTEALREAVRTGRLAPGSKLPSSRTLATDLGLARNTVVAAYGSLIDEGWLTARPGAGTVVARRTPPPTTPRPLPAQEVQPLHDLRPGRPDTSSFPRADWSRATRRALEQAPHEVFTYSSPFGRIELRRALADYLARARGVYADPSRILVCSGASHGLSLLATALRARQVHRIAVESYGMPMLRDRFTAAGLRTVAVPVDADGARIGRLPGVGALLLTPAHQFPTGAPLHPARRAAVVDWARQTGGMIVEDDYDGEFRYDRKPVGALQGLSPEHVVYLGTASKTVAPGLRLGWMVLPDALADDVARALGGVSQTSALDQLVLAELLDSGAYDRHVRAMRAQYRQRRDDLTSALPGRVHGISAGLHALVELPRGTENAVLREAAAQKLALLGLDWFRHPATEPERDAVVVGFATPSRSGWPAALAALTRVLA